MFGSIVPIAALLCISINGGNSEITVRPVDTEVKVGDSTYFNCSISDPSADISWFHYPVGKRTDYHQYVYLNGHLQNPYDKRFRVEKQVSTGSFNLVVLNAETSDAGLYVCQNGGTDSAVYAELIVIEVDPTCATNIGNSEFIGPNSCHLQENVVQLNCSINYKGNIPPQLHITNVKGGVAYPVPRSPCVYGDGRVTCNYAESSEIGMDGSFFVCHANRSRNTRYSCKTEAVKIHYAIGERNPAQKVIGDVVSCPVNTSSTECSYRWIWSDGNAEETVSENRPLEIAKIGWYRCQVSCPLVQNSCNFDAMLFLASAPTDSSTNSGSSTPIIIAVVATFACCCGIGIVVFAVVMCCRRKKTKGSGENLDDEAAARMALLVQSTAIKCSVENKDRTDPDLDNTDAKYAVLTENDELEALIRIGDAYLDPRPIEEAVKKQLPCISNCMLVGHQRKFLSILLTIKTDVDPITSEPMDRLSPEVIEWIKSINGNATTVSEIEKKKCKPLTKAIKDGIDRVNSTENKSYGHDIKKWAILPRELSMTNNELDEKGNIQRESVARNFKSIIDQIYADSGRDSIEA